MAPRFKLTLDSLKFISLVDRPAQETATVRLVKRDNSDEVPTITATARIMKLGDGPDPLIYGWAFTCTGPDGAVYHDLQGDAVTDFIKAAEEYFASGAPADEMHREGDGIVGRIAFGMPMDGDIAKAFFGDEIGKLIKTSGLMIAVRAAPDALAKVRDGTYTGFSIAGTGTREVVKTDPAPAVKAAGKKKGKRKGQPAQTTMPGMASEAYKRIVKMGVLTSITDGHQHSLCPDDPEHSWMMLLSTSYQTSEGATEGHCHAWTFDMTTGVITIGEDSGHTHTTTAVVPPDVLAEVAAQEADERKCPKCGYCCDADDCFCPMCGCRMDGMTAVSNAVPAPVDDKPSGPTVVVVAARAPEGDGKSTDSTQSGPGNTVNPQEQEMPTEQELSKTIADLRKMLAASLALTEPQRAHVVKQAPADQESFLMLDLAGRESIVKAANDANPVVFKTAGGIEIRKSDGPVAEMLARQADTQAEIIKSQTAQLEIQKAAAELVTLEKRAAADLSHFAKGVSISAAILKAVDGIADEATRTAAIEALKGANAAMKTIAQPIGASSGGEPEAGDPSTKLTELAKKHAADNKMPFAKAYEAVLMTAEGAELYEQVSKRTPTLSVVQ